MKERKTTWFSKCIFKAVRWLVRLFYGKTDVVGIENLPEKDETNNNILNKFQENFIDVARFYYKKPE